jgi:Transposase
MGQLHALIAEHAEQPDQVVVGIETDRGLWVAALVAAGYQVFAVNPLAVARYRDGHHVSGAKSHASDAKLLADLVRSDPLNGFLVGVLLGFDAVRAAGVEASYRGQIDARNFDFAVTGRLAAARGEPDVTLTASPADLVTARLGATATHRQAALRRMRFDGEDGDVDRMRTILQLTGESVSASAS